MSERLAVDSLMTADGEVVQLPTLGPLGPVDAEGGRIPLDTVRLFDAEGRLLKVESYEFSTWSQRWVVHLGSDRDAYADDCYLSRPDSFERLLKDLGEALQQDARGGDVRERSLDRPNVMSVTCPSCGLSNSIAWGSLTATPQKEAVAMLADSWNSR